MQCISTPLSEDQLLAVMSDVAEEAILDHLRQCEFCQIKLSQLEQAEMKLRQKLFRWDCPSPDKLGEFALNMWLETEQNQIAEHVKSCPACQADLSELRQFMDAIDQDEERERQNVNQKLSQPMRPPRPNRPLIRVPMPTMQRAVLQGAALRGDDPQVFEFEGLKMVVLVTQAEGHYELSGQLLGRVLGHWYNGLVKAEQVEGRSVLCVIDERNKFQCRLQTDGDISLTISAQDGTVIRVEGIKVPLG